MKGRTGTGTVTHFKTHKNWLKEIGGFNPIPDLEGLNCIFGELRNYRIFSDKDAKSFLLLIGIVVSLIIVFYIIVFTCVCGKKTNFAHIHMEKIEKTLDETDAEVYNFYSDRHCKIKSSYRSLFKIE